MQRSLSVQGTAANNWRSSLARSDSYETFHVDSNVPHRAGSHGDVPEKKREIIPDRMAKKIWQASTDGDQLAMTNLYHEIQGLNILLNCPKRYYLAAFIKTQSIIW